MQPFKIGPSHRLEKSVPVWDSAAAQWKQHALKTPRLIQSPPQKLDEEQTGILKDYVGLLADKIKVDAALKRERDRRIEAGPLDYLTMQYGVLCNDGYGQIEDTPKMAQMQKYVFHMVDRYNEKQITWDVFEDEVDRWFLMVLETLERRNGPVKQ